MIYRTYSIHADLKCVKNKKGLTAKLKIIVTPTGAEPVLPGCPPEAGPPSAEEPFCLYTVGVWCPTFRGTLGLI
ncbi:MAG: hypothetical protein A2Y67_02640 [Candidatus Buchananbacteria bacterium RBG_13_39_9]|uniref:Uncharacterized protein n=1 Tax=Candidatus Buchananbacteria bacterium RBG_13_39_9 TaxID=1797531 RepID=A0A1G1XSG8_9BACT|nr:MAG: hypothetical protein A2Y67_02640 [Candidatus Buchananbacteria bacterium RBG_13_39_9]